MAPADFFVLRTPLLPFSELCAWSEGPARAPGDDEAALDEHRRVLRDRLRSLISRPEVREALFVASPSLDDSLPQWLTDPESEQGQKVERALVRYVSRMVARPTPFGLFAGISVGTVGDGTRLHIEGQNAWRRHCRPDAGYLWTLAQAISADREIRRFLVHRPNTSLNRVGPGFRYIAENADGPDCTYRLAATERTEALDAVLAAAAGGADLHALARSLADEEITAEEWLEFIEEMVDGNILVSDLQLQVTGPEPVHDLIAQLAALPQTRAIAERLQAIANDLAALDAAPLGVSPERYDAIRRQLEGLPAEVDRSRVAQVDLVKPARELRLGPEPIAEILRAHEILSRIVPAADNERLARFRRAFVERYEDREIPLMTALDEEMGVGFGSQGDGRAEPALVEGLAFGGPLPGPAAPRAVTWGPWHALLLKRLQQALRTGAQEINLTNSELEKLARPEGEARPSAASPGSWAAMVSLATASEEALAAGDFLIWLQGFALPGASLLGRFCHVDPRLHRHVQAYLREEDAAAGADAERGPIFAEVVHLPEGRLGNVSFRPVLREYEIPFLARSGAPRDRQIPLDDLLVSVKHDRVILRSRRLGREVRPCLTNAHNIWQPSNIATYQFLCCLHAQGRDVPHLGWGALEDSPFLPRVRMGRVVLTLARWNLDEEDLEPLRRVEGAARHARLQELRRTRGLPRFIAIADDPSSPDKLTIDLDNVLTVENLFQLIKDRPRLAVVEVFEPERLCASAPEGRFVHELVVPLLPRGTVSPATLPPPAPAVNIERTFLPGSEWLFAKLYTGPATSDRLLREALAPVVADALSSGAADRWFFVRYDVPDHHLRLRFHGSPERLRNEVEPALAAAAQRCLGDAQLWKMQLDSYEREVERYGGDRGMFLSERLFHADSQAVLDLMGVMGRSLDPEARWRLALLGMDLLLDDLGFDLAARRGLVANCREAFAREHGLAAAGERALGARFRQVRAGLESLLNDSAEADDALASRLAPGIAVLRARSQRVRPIGAALRAPMARLSRPLEDLASSYLHMHANRLIASEPRRHELVLYDFLHRLYDSKLARSQKQASRSVHLASA